MKGNNARRSRGSALGGVGFYLLLLLCLTAVGIAGYYALFPVNAGSEEPGEESLPMQTVEVQPVLEVTLLPEVEPEPEPQPEPEPEPLPVTLQTPVEEVKVTEPQLVVAPLQGKTVAAFSAQELCYNVTLDDWRTHNGMDIAAEAGTPVMAACAGEVLGVAEDDLMGTTVVVSHGDGYETVYANLQAVPTVTVGQKVRAGEILGAVGATSLAESALEPHLHFEVNLEGTPVDPQEFLDR